jgi:hypothetical protein
MYDQAGRPAVERKANKKQQNRSSAERDETVRRSEVTKQQAQTPS